MTVTIALQSYVGWKASLTVLHVIAITSTIYRIFHRFKIQRVWFDDYLAFIPLIANILFFIALWVRFPGDGPLPRATQQEYRYRVVSSFWFATFLCITIVWSTRAMLALSMARIFPPGDKYRRWCVGLAWFMLFCWALIFIVVNATCKHTSGLLHGNGAGGCKMADKVPLKFVILATFDLLSDALLVATPVVLFSKLNLPATQRRLMTAVFCGSVMTGLSVIVFAIFTFSGWSLGRDTGLIFLGLSSIESTLSIIAANLAVIATCFYRFSRRSELSDSGDEKTSDDASARHGRAACTCTSEERPGNTMLFSGLFRSSRGVSSEAPTAGDYSGESGEDGITTHGTTTHGTGKATQDSS